MSCVVCETCERCASASTSKPNGKLGRALRCLALLSPLKPEFDRALHALDEGRVHFGQALARPSAVQVVAWLRLRGRTSRALTKRIRTLTGHGTRTRGLETRQREPTPAGADLARGAPRTSD